MSQFIPPRVNGGNVRTPLACTHFMTSLITTIFIHPHEASLAIVRIYLAKSYEAS